MAVVVESIDEYPDEDCLQASRPPHDAVRLELQLEEVGHWCILHHHRYQERVDGTQAQRQQGFGSQDSCRFCPWDMGEIEAPLEKPKEVLLFLCVLARVGVAALAGQVERNPWPLP